MKREPPKPTTPRHDTEGEKEEKNMDFIFCNDRGQRVSKAVCQANVKKGTCKQDLLRCKKARTPKATQIPDDRYLDPFSKEIMKKKIKEEKEKATYQDPTDLYEEAINQTFKDLDTPTLEVDHHDHLHILDEPTPSDEFEKFIDNELDKERRKDPLHPINRKERGKAIQFNLFSERDDNFGEYGPSDEMGEGETE